MNTALASALLVLLATAAAAGGPAVDAPRDPVLLASPAQVMSIRATAPKKKSLHPGAKAAEAPEADDGRIYGGFRVARGFGHWQVEIYRDFAPEDWAYHVTTTHDTRPEWQLAHHCGGALVAEDWVLTAAHCVLNGDPAKHACMLRSGYTCDHAVMSVSKQHHASLAQCIKANQIDPVFHVRLGADDISHSDGISYRIDCAVVHPDWNPADFYHNDIALVHFSADGAPPTRDATKIQLIRMHTHAAPDTGTSVTVTGWGKSQPVPGIQPNAVLLQTELQIKNSESCAKQLRVRPDQLDDNVLCAGAAEHKTCLGDSGGPVVLTEGRPYYLVGVVSWGAKDCKADAAPGVYTRIGAFATWIDDVLEAERD